MTLTKCTQQILTLGPDAFSDSQRSPLAVYLLFTVLSKSALKSCLDEQKVSLLVNGHFMSLIPQEVANQSRLTLRNSRAELLLEVS